MKKVDLSDQAFKSVGITFNHVQYKLFHGDENYNEELQKAFPQYFEKDKVEEEVVLKPTEVEMIDPEPVVEEQEEENIEPSTEQTQIKSEEVIEVVEQTETPDSRHEETVSHQDPHNHTEEQQGIVESYENMWEDTKESIVEEVEEVVEEQDVFEDFASTEPIPEALEIKEVKVFDQALTEEDVKDFTPNEEVPMGHKVPTIIPSETSKIEIFFKTLIDSGSKVVNNTLEFVMSLRFITMTAMIMIAVSAIYFDIDGWRETYHRLGSTQVTFIIVSLYVAKMAIIKILSVGVDKETLKGHWTDKLAFYANHYMLRSIMVASLLGMILVSSAGIYSSLAVNTVGDVKEVTKGDSKIEFIDKRLESVDGRVVLVREQIKNMEEVMRDIPENQISKRKKMVDQINKLNDKIYELQNSKTEIEAEKEQAMIALNEKQTDNTNKALNFTAELLGVSLLELLKFINLLMTFVLEITYLSLTWLVVRLDKYSIRKS